MSSQEPRDSNVASRNLRVVEVRRHSYTKKGESRGIGSHLSADGVRLARAVGAAKPLRRSPT